MTHDEATAYQRWLVGEMNALLAINSVRMMIATPLVWLSRVHLSGTMGGVVIPLMFAFAMGVCLRLPVKLAFVILHNRRVLRKWNP